MRAPLCLPILLLLTAAPAAAQPVNPAPAAAQPVNPAAAQPVNPAAARPVNPAAAQPPAPAAVDPGEQPAIPSEPAPLRELRAPAPPGPPGPPVEDHKDAALATYAARHLQRGIFFGPVETWGTGLLFWQGAGVGPKLRRRLLDTFATVEAIRDAPPEAVQRAVAFKGPPALRAQRTRFLLKQIGRPARGGVVIPSSWNVLDGYGAAMSPRTLALRVGAYDVLERIDREAEAAATINIGAGIITTILMSLGALDLRATAGTAAYPSQPPPALAHQAALRQRRGLAFLIAGAALSTATGSVGSTMAVMHNRLVTFWTEDDLDGVIQRYNEDLQAELGITADDVGRYLRRRGVAPRVIPGPTGVTGEF